MSSGLSNADHNEADASVPILAFIGLGAMGLPMATRLAAKFRVNVFDPVEENVTRATKSGGRGFSTPSDAAADASAVVLAVRTLSQVEDALFGVNGVTETLSSGSIVIVTSTIGVPGAKSIADRLARFEILMVDAPVSGGPVRASLGDLLMMVGASEGGLRAVRPVLERLASTIVEVGANIGDGQALKTVNQLLCGVHIAAAAEALALAKGLGLNPAAALEALGAGAASSFMLANRGPRIVQALDAGSPEVLSRVDIFVKDLGIVADAGRSVGLALPVAAAAEQLYRLSESAGLGASDDSMISTIL
jgi:3-hydroxyisobutyrate dehydrogenase